MYIKDEKISGNDNPPTSMMIKVKYHYHHKTTVMDRLFPYMPWSGRMVIPLKETAISFLMILMWKTMRCISMKICHTKWIGTTHILQISDWTVCCHSWGSHWDKKWYFPSGFPQSRQKYVLMNNLKYAIISI